MSLGEASEWTLHAKCRNMADALFPEGKDQKKVRGICMSCPVRLECLAEALDNRVEWGIWGGMTERERRQLLRSRPGAVPFAPRCLRCPGWKLAWHGQRS